MGLLDFMKQGTQWLTDNTGMDWNAVQTDPGLAAKRLMGAPVDLNSQYQAQPTQDNLLNVETPTSNNPTWDETTGWTTPTKNQMSEGIMTPLVEDNIYPNMNQVNTETSLPPSLTIGGYDRNIREPQKLDFSNRDQSNINDNLSSVMNSDAYVFNTGTNTYNNTDPVTLKREAEAKAKLNPDLIAPSLLGENFGYESAPTGGNAQAKAGNINLGNEAVAVGRQIPTKDEIQDPRKVINPFKIVGNLFPQGESAVDNNTYTGDLSKMNQIMSLEGVSDADKILILQEHGLPIPDSLGK